MIITGPSVQQISNTLSYSSRDFSESRLVTYSRVEASSRRLTSNSQISTRPFRDAPRLQLAEPRVFLFRPEPATFPKPHHFIDMI